MLKTSYQKYTLFFKFNAGTSRGVLTEKDTWFIKVWDTNNPGVFGLGEAGPLKKLSIDDREDFEPVLADILQQLEQQAMPQSTAEIYALAGKLAGAAFPSLRFALETALLDLTQGGQRMIFDNSFYHDQKGIPINGLIWMGDTESMLLQVANKVGEGADCIKIKIGAMDFEKECDILDFIRRRYFQNELILRVDANGAFKPSEALDKLNQLDQYNLHSIEQPIVAGQVSMMKELCATTPVPIALDEELIGIHELKDKQKLLETILPQYIILKPTLVGGIQSCLEWISIAEVMGIGWWMTSALESNIGLNAIAQLTYEMNAKGHQGLGTGQLYHNNIDSPLTIDTGQVSYRSSQEWDFSPLSL